ESDLPFKPCETCGTYSATVDGNLIYIVGGNYLQPNDASDNYYYSKNGGKTWKKSKKGPSGYRSSIVKKNTLLFSAGSNGLDFSRNNGKSWKKLNSKNYFALVFSDNYLIASGVNGTLDFYNLKQWTQ
ncbi:MAG: glycoside hydrolase, partial [Bacteroidetes bacterium]|nr:glycoside hydrolase [Bacteroidota bacterium]